MVDDTCVFHGEKLSFSSCQLVWIQVVKIGKNRWTRTNEEMMAHLIVGRRSCKPIGGENVGKLLE